MFINEELILKLSVDKAKKNEEHFNGIWGFGWTQIHKKWCSFGMLFNRELVNSSEQKRNNLT